MSRTCASAAWSTRRSQTPLSAHWDLPELLHPMYPAVTASSSWFHPDSVVALLEEHTSSAEQFAAACRRLSFQHISSAQQSVTARRRCGRKPTGSRWCCWTRWALTMGTTHHRLCRYPNDPLDCSLAVGCTSLPMRIDNGGDGRQRLSA